MIFPGGKTKVNSIVWKKGEPRFNEKSISVFRNQNLKNGYSFYEQSKVCLADPADDNVERSNHFLCSKKNKSTADVSSKMVARRKQNTSSRRFWNFKFDIIPLTYRNGEEMCCVWGAPTGNGSLSFPLNVTKSIVIILFFPVIFPFMGSLKTMYEKSVDPLF